MICLGQEAAAAQAAAKAAKAAVSQRLVRVTPCSTHRDDAVLQLPCELLDQRFS
jgi:hypothetical protein